MADTVDTTTVVIDERDERDERVEKRAGSSDGAKERKTLVACNHLKTLVGRKGLRCSYCNELLTFYRDFDSNTGINFVQNAVRVEPGNEKTGPYFVQNACMACFAKDSDFLVRLADYYRSLLAKVYEIRKAEEKHAALSATVAELKSREGMLQGRALREAIEERTSVMAEVVTCSRRIEALKAYVAEKKKFTKNYSCAYDFLCRFALSTYVCCTKRRDPAEDKIERLVNDSSLRHPQAAYEHIQSQQTRRVSRIDPRADDDDFVDDDAAAEGDEAEDTASKSEASAQDDTYAARASAAAASSDEDDTPTPAAPPVKNVYAKKPKVKAAPAPKKNALPTFTPADLKTIEALKACGVGMEEIMMMLKK